MFRTGPRLRLQPAPAGEKASLGDLLRTLSATEQLGPVDQVATVSLFNGDPEPVSTWPEAKVAPVARTIAFGEITDAHVVLVQALNQPRGDGTVISLEEVGAYFQAAGTPPHRVRAALRPHTWRT
jgi:hypothetical protein